MFSKKFPFERASPGTLCEICVAFPFHGCGDQSENLTPSALQNVVIKTERFPIIRIFRIDLNRIYNVMREAVIPCYDSIQYVALDKFWISRSVKFSIREMLHALRNHSRQ